MRKFFFLLTILACLLAGCGRNTEPEATGVSLLETNPYTAEDFEYQDGRMICRTSKAIAGIDVSVHQGDIDWEAVASDGIRFAMIRVGFRGYLDGQIHEDANARANIEGALAAGLDVGVYFFSQALTVQEAEEEAEFLLDFISGSRISMPVVFDWETVEDPQARTTEPQDRKTLTDLSLAFCAKVKAAGYKPMVYFNRYQGDDLLDLWQLREYGFWLAQYDAPMTFPWRISMWQYSDKGTVAGITEKVDMNLYFP